MRFTQQDLRRHLKAALLAAQDKPVIITHTRARVRSVIAVVVGVERARELGLLAAEVEEVKDGT